MALRVTLLGLALAGAPPSVERLHINPATPGAKVFSAEQVRLRTIAESVLAPGRVERDEQSLKVVATPLSGRVLRVLVAVGTRVHKGQELLELASPEVESARSAAIQAESNLDVARRAVEKIQFDASSVSSKDLDQARGNLKRGQAQVDKTKRTLAAMGVDPHSFTSLYVVRSPVDGTVLDVLAATGAELRPGEHAFRLGDPHHWTVVFQARAGERGLQPLEPVEVAIDGRADPIHAKNPPGGRAGRLWNRAGHGGPG